MSDALAEGKTRAANHRGKVGARVHPHGLGLGLGGGHGLLLSGYPNNAGLKWCGMVTTLMYLSTRAE